MKTPRYSPEQAAEDISARWLHAVRDVRKPATKPAPLFWQSLRELRATLSHAVNPALLAVLAALAVGCVALLVLSLFL